MKLASIWRLQEARAWEVSCCCSDYFMQIASLDLFRECSITIGLALTQYYAAIEMILILPLQTDRACLIASRSRESAKSWQKHFRTKIHDDHSTSRLRLQSQSRNLGFLPNTQQSNQNGIKERVCLQPLDQNRWLQARKFGGSSRLIAVLVVVLPATS